MKYTHVFLDFDDTIYDTHGNAQEALMELYQHFNLQGQFENFEYFAQLYWKRNREVWAQYSLGNIRREELVVERFAYPFREVGCPVDEQKALELNAWFMNQTSTKGRLVEGALDLLEYLRPKYQIHLLSNGFEEVQYRKMKYAGVDHFFDHVILSDHIGVNKPDVRLFAYALEQVGAKASEVIMIGDNYDTDIIGAINSSIDQIYYHSLPLSGCAQEPTYQVATLEQIKSIL